MARLPERVRIGVVGLGWVGQEVARAALEDPRVRLVGVADVDPVKAGRDLGEILGEGRLGLPIDADVESLLARARPEVAILSTSSDVRSMRPTLEACLAHGAHVVTSCENLASPELLEGDLARALDEAARKADVVILATGVNPGFAMDRLPVMLSQATRNIRRVRVSRVVDVASRRAQLQAKVGVGMSSQEFVAAMSESRVGHAGLSASLRLVAKGLGVSLDRTTETLRPLIAETPTSSSVLGPVPAGRVRGIYQVARGYRGETELITLELTIALDEPNARDVIDIVGEPPLRFSGELPGDTCTVATVLSAIPLMVTMPAGLRTVLDVPLEQPEEPIEARGDGLEATRSATALPAKTVESAPPAQGRSTTRRAKPEGAPQGKKSASKKARAVPVDGAPAAVAKKPRAPKKRKKETGEATAKPKRARARATS